MNLVLTQKLDLKKAGEIELKKPSFAPKYGITNTEKGKERVQMKVSFLFCTVGSDL